MIKAHIFLDGELVHRGRLEHCYRVGDTVRVGELEDSYVRVTEVIWCLNESSPEGQRVNIRMERWEETA